MIAGGRRSAKGRPARAETLISNGRVDFVRITDGGAGYVDPIAVIVEPGLPFTDNIPHRAHVS